MHARLALTHAGIHLIAFETAFGRYSGVVLLLIGLALAFYCMSCDTIPPFFSALVSRFISFCRQNSLYILFCSRHLRIRAISTHISSYLHLQSPCEILHAREGLNLQAQRQLRHVFLGIHASSKHHNTRRIRQLHRVPRKACRQLFSAARLRLTHVCVNRTKY
jgi:hypothetical protein